MCIAGATDNRQWGQLDMLLMKAYTGGLHLNPDLYHEGHHYYIIASDGEKQWLSNTLEGKQFALRCRCGWDHYRYATLKSIRTQANLFCQFCEHDARWWKAVHKEHVPACEVEAMQALKQLGLDKQVACQVRLPYWHGRVDFYHIPTKTVTQVDGSSHFTCMHHRQSKTQLIKDIECCSQAWKEGVRLLRMHHQHGPMGKVMLAATQMPYPSFVMLTREYESVSVCINGVQLKYADWVAMQLPGAYREIHRESNCIIFR